MEEEHNPFLLQGYAGGATFCDRVEELASLREAMANQRNVTLISLRRLGKTALVRHFFASQRKATPVFVDLYRTTDQAGMVQMIVQEAVRQVGKPTGTLLQELAKAMRSVEFSLSVDAISGMPELGVSIRPGQRQGLALDELFRFLERQRKPVIVALDEFQQVTGYPETNTEAVLREQVQKSRNVQFIFAGSDRRMMQALFTDSKRPFFQSTEPLYLGPIPEEAYTAFILRHFKAGRRRIDPSVVGAGLAWCRSHTYYVQYLFNRVWSTGNRAVGIADLERIKASILKERAPEYMTLRRLLSPNQVALLAAIAKEGTIKAPTAMAFVHRHRLSAPSTVRQSLGVLVEKELVYQADGRYAVTDVFLGHWLAEG
ncbi:MAG: ATP-binding protein [Flavobacteriales bacterium]|nr:ATP-binding protein [Flavobacteriales bacterium]MBP9078814.1 ATP-binding protein [Flavobacteriales bacterium]